MRCLLADLYFSLKCFAFSWSLSFFWLVMANGGWVMLDAQQKDFAINAATIGACVVSLVVFLDISITALNDRRKNK